MSVVFLKILNISLVAGWMILAVLLLRLFLKKAPRWITCILWALVAIRLILPFSFESVLSLVPSAEVIPQDITTTQQPVINSGIRVVNNAVNPVITETFAPEVGDSVNPLQVIVPIASIVWIAGVIVMFGYVLVSYFVLKKQVSTAIPDKKSKLPVFLSDDIRTPFILGIIRPRIYLPSSLDRETRRYVVAHEKAHLKRHDHWWKPLGFLLLSVYWFHPLCWVAYILLCKDIEAACDEKVIRNKEKDYLAAYSQALLDCAVQRKQISACPLAFGENGVKNRVKGILNYKKPAFWIIIAAIICVIAASVCFLTNPKRKENRQIPETGSEIPLEVLKNETLEESNLPENGMNSTAGDFYNLYKIDENGTLWASGYNNFGQLGQGNSDSDYHPIPVKVAENVIHVDYGLNAGFVIYLTKDYKLYGFGSNYTNALLQFEDYDENRFHNPERYTVGGHILLLENVEYAECGRYDVAALKKDGSVWTWGMLATSIDWGYTNQLSGYEIYTGPEYLQQYLKQAYLTKPQKILEDVKQITGGFYNHAAVKNDGTLWTWGYNASGNCAVKDSYVVLEPTKVAENVQMVWTEKMQNQIVQDISEYGEFSDGRMENTLIYKNDGKYYICGLGYGERRVLPHYYEASDYEVICTSDFVPIAEKDAKAVLGISGPAEITEGGSSDIQLSDWLSEIRLPGGYYATGYSEYIGYMGGMHILPKVHYSEWLGSYVEVADWLCSGMISRISADDPQVKITYTNGIPDMSGVPIHNHTAAEYLEVIGLERSDTQWSAIMLKESHDLYTQAEIEDLKTRGVDTENIEKSVEYWYFWFVKEGADYYYVLSLSADQFSKEEALQIAKTVRVKE